MMEDSFGVLINGKHTYRDYKLLWIAPYSIESPEEKRYRVEVPASDGVLDMTRFLTGDDVKYHNRKMKFQFNRDGDYVHWEMLTSQIKNDLHGKLCPIIPDSGRDFVYYGVVTVESEKETLENACDITISVDADPYKYERYSSLEKWKWDDFNFVTGIIREYKDLVVNGTMMLMIPGRRKKVVPVFECSDKMKLDYDGHTYELPAGRSKIIDLQLGEGEHFLLFTGIGTVSVDYRGASL